MTRPQKVALTAGAGFLAFALLFPPWRYETVQLPYRVSWPPLRPPVRGFYGYSPLTIGIDAPELDRRTLQQLANEVQKDLAASRGRGEMQNLRQVVRKFQIDPVRLVPICLAILLATGGVLFVFRGRPRPSDAKAGT